MHFLAGSICRHKVGSTNSLSGTQNGTTISDPNNKPDQPNVCIHKPSWVWV